MYIQIFPPLSEMNSLKQNYAISFDRCSLQKGYRNVWAYPIYDENDIALHTFYRVTFLFVSYSFVRLIL